jgi:HAD superfamily phosphoserine phosphatase-like hydrolase
LENLFHFKKSAVVAVFDFDHTLIRGDSLWPFLACLAGWPRAFAALTEAVFLFIIRYLKKDPATADRRTFIKARLLRRLLGGRNPNSLVAAIEKLQIWCAWNEPIRQKLLDHYGKGHRIVVASGSLDLYLPALLKELPAHDLICTEVEIKNGAVTGAMPAGNCVRARKADMLKTWLAANGPFEESWGYGNFPHDLPMLNLLDHRIIVS